MINVDLNQIPTITAFEAEMLVGVPAEDFAQPGTYHILVGSRGEIDDFEYLGETSEIQVPTIDEIVQECKDNGDTELDEAREYFEEFYGLMIEEDHVNFGYTEEGYDVWLKIA